jgi:gliding motility-associated-like protein
LWSNGSTNVSLLIEKPGTYWLEVIDQKGCTGRDSLKISSKLCPVSVYVPTAFTANGDGKNDVFKATVLGKTKLFELIVYNRWGEIVFQTNDPSRSWNGKLNGNDLGSGVFVWICRYAFEGDNKGTQLKKGTLTLIR